MATNTIEINVPNYGILRGSIDQEREIAVFRNVPYAVILDRWRAAVKPQPWKDVRDATEQGPICPQKTSDFPLFLVCKPLENIKYDEKECLNMNIYVPLKSLQKGADPIPVMTWIHGGALREGSNAWTLYDASNMVQQSIQMNKPVIVVCINYRVGIFGFLASRELEDEMKDLVANDPSISTYNQSIGNWGLMDQKLAFEWVRENIAAFGGNQRDVTAFGESAGSISIHYHMLCPAHHGLFDRAIMQSGTATSLPPGRLHKDGQALFDSLLQKLDIPLDLDSKEKMRRLREVPTEKLNIAGTHVIPRACNPYYDGGKVIPSKVPIQVLAQDLSAYDPNIQSILIGTTKDEGTAFATMFGDTSMENWPNLVKNLFRVPELASLFESVYGTPQTDEEAFLTGSRYAGDVLFHNPTQILVGKLRELAETRKGFKVAQYRFDVAMQRLTELAPGFGAMHAGDLPFVFCSVDMKPYMTKEELTVSKKMQLIWIGFANQDADISEMGNIHFAIPDQVYGTDETDGQWDGLYLSKEASDFWSTAAKLQQEALMAEFQ
ncbi:Alpha/Beta hydrolase protein [Mortierella sp. GBAus27b]|nr:Alpha/Beta hydrolase protein [Mortierella sp. GBAus27b]